MIIVQRHIIKVAYGNVSREASWCRGIQKEAANREEESVGLLSATDVLVTTRNLCR